MALKRAVQKIAQKATGTVFVPAQKGAREILERVGSARQSALDKGYVSRSLRARNVNQGAMINIGGGTTASGQRINAFGQDIEVTGLTNRPPRFEAAPYNLRSQGFNEIPSERALSVPSATRSLVPARQGRALGPDDIIPTPSAAADNSSFLDNPWIRRGMAMGVGFGAYYLMTGTRSRESDMALQNARNRGQLGNSQLY